MAENKRDVEFIIRARDLSSRTFREVSGAVDGLTSSLDKQISAASRGEISANELKTAYRGLDQAGRALLAKQGMIDYYRKVSDALDAADVKARDLRQTQETLTAAQAGAENTTKAQERALVKATKAADAAEKKAASLRDTLTTQSDRLKQTGIDTDNLAGSQRQLVQVAGQVGDALVKTGAALDNYEANVRGAKAAQQELANAADLAAFRQIGTAAAANAQDVNRGKVALDDYAQASDSVASRLRRIVDPTRAAGESIDTLAAEVERLDGIVGNADRPIREYQDAIYDLGQAQRAILSQAGSIDGFRAQEAAVERASRAVEAARADVLQYASAVELADEPNRDLVTSLRRAEAALESENRELDLQNKKLASLSGNLKRAGIDVKNLTGAEQRLEAASNTSSAALTRLDRAAAGKNNKAGAFLGLRAYELQNLSYQINDVFTQIASGTSVTQTFAQQGGQIFQIFPRAFGAIAAFLPELAAIAAVLVSVGAAFKNVVDLESSTRQFAGSLALTADEGLYSAETLAENAHQLDVFGTSLENARKEVAIFLKAGLDPTMIERFGKAAQDLADVTGTDVPDAAKLMADGFTGGYKEVAKLDDELNFLTASERELIRVMFDSGDAAGARMRAFEAFERQADRAADKARGSWSDAFRSLTNVWDSLLSSIADSKPFQEAIGWLDQLSDAAERWANNSGDGSWGLPGSSFQRQQNIPAFDGANLMDPNATGPYTQQNAAMFRGLLSTPGWTRPEWMGGQAGANAQGNIVLTDELRDVAAMAYLEAINNPQAQRDVAAVIVNRVRATGKNGSQVVRAPGQFEPYSARRGEFDAARNNDARVLAVLENILPILQGRVQDPTNGATLFVSPGGQAAENRAMPAWADPANRTLSRYGHEFYTGRIPGDQRGTDTTINETEARTKAGQDQLRALREEIGLRDKNNHELRLEVAERNARERLSGGTAAQQDEAGRLARADEQRKINEEVAKEAEQAARRTEADNRRLTAMADTLRGDLRGLETRAQRAQDNSLEARLAAIDTQFSGIEQNLREAEAAGVRQVDGLTLDQYRGRVEANKLILKQQEQMAFYEDQVKALEEEREARLQRIADQASAGNIEIDEAFRQALAVNAELAPKIEKMAADAVVFAQSIAGATPNPALDAFIANMQQVGAREERPGTTGPVAKSGREQLRAGESELNDLITQRNDLVANYVRLVELGTMTQQDAQDKTAEAYRATQPLIVSQVEEILRLAEAMRAAGTMTEAEFLRIRTALEVTSQEAQYVDANFTRLRNNIEQNLAQGVTNTFNAIAASLAGLIDGTMTWGEALDNIWNVARAGVADFLAGIADVLMQIAVMQAIKSLPFLSGLTSGIMDFTGLAAGAGVLAAAGTTVGASAAAVGVSATTLAASSVPLMAAAGALGAAAAAMTAAAYLQLAANATGGILHAGGVVGSSSSGVSRSVSSLAFMGAPRHHTGALVGLSSDEHAAILQRGEEVLAKNDPRNILNGGAAAGGQGQAPAPVVRMKVVNAIDSGQFVSEGVATRAGEQAIMNFIGRRTREIRSKLGV